MSYEQLYKLYKSGDDFEPLVLLEKQPLFAAVSLSIAVLIILAAISGLSNLTKGQKNSGIYSFLQYVVLCAIGSGLLGIGVVFLSNSFEVYL